MSKAAVLEAILERLRADLALYTKAADSARAEATDEQSKAENKYDTRGLEASYLARGQSRQARETEMALEQFRALHHACTTSSMETIAVGALVQLKSGRELSWYFVGPKAGGTDVLVDGRQVLVITPQSPLGRQLMGHRHGEKIQVELGTERRENMITSVA